MRCRRRQLLVFPLLWSVAGCSSLPQGAVSLNGSWRPVAAVFGGKDEPIESFHGKNLLLRDGSYQFGDDVARYVILSTAWPGKLDIIGLGGAVKGRRVPATFVLLGDKLVICYQLGEGPPPEELESPAGSHIMQITYRRVLE